MPLIACGVMFALPWIAVPRDAALGSLLRGLFDIGDPQRDFQIVPFALLSFIALMTAATVAITARLILLDGGSRFRLDPLPASAGLQLLIRLVPGLAAVAIVAGAWVQSEPHVGPWNSLGGIGVGLTAFVLLLTVVHDWLWDRVFRHVPVKAGFGAFLVDAAWLMFKGFRSLVRFTPSGFVDAHGRIYARHAFAMLQFLFSMLLFLSLLVVKANWDRFQIEWLSWLHTSGPPRVPTLCLLLVLVMLACWGLSWLTFLFDRHRVPLLSILVAYFWETSIFPQGDHFFRSIARVKETVVQRPMPAAVLARRAGQPAIVVAATGGGIQASAWTARVIADLQRDSDNCRPKGDTDYVEAFDRSLLTLSAVSGGSVGGMYIADAYRDGRLNDRLALQTAVKSAEASSLDEVAWGLTYQDFFWTLAPMLKGVSIWPPHLLNGRHLVDDRGTALENAWKRTAGLATATLDSWRQDVAAGRRPAVIFGATIAETGQRMVLSTTSLDGTDIGRRDFLADYPDADVAVTTAARLSATFPIVSPPARIVRHGVFANEFHFVDGGYYDNYGTATLVEWLQSGLNATGSPRPSRILVLQIRSFPMGDPGQPEGERGTFFELSQPIETLYHVRGTGQLSHSDLNVRLLQSVHGPTMVQQVTITFPARLADEQDDASPPLSWHLTPLERGRLEQASHDPDVVKQRRAVHRFLMPGDVNADTCVLR